MHEKLTDIFDFLVKNREYNFILQQNYYKNCLLPHNEIAMRVYSLLYHIANTQSQPKIDKLAIFYRLIHANMNQLTSFGGFVRLLNNNEVREYNYKSLFETLRQQDGWGEKTAALFSKSIYHLHNGKYDSSLTLWSDAPSHINENDTMHLPVDSVIKYIFAKISPGATWNFTNINNLLSIHYHGDQIEVWDDLWFWGYITQRSMKNDRVLQWNEDKYWALFETEKDTRRIAAIKETAKHFISLIEKHSA